MTGPERFDVVVVGARVAGASTAMLLARTGMRVALVDRAPYGSDTNSTHGLMRAGVLQLGRWGVLPDVVAAGTPAIRRTLFHHGPETVTVSIRPTPYVDALYAPRRQLLDRILVDAAAAAGVDVRHGLAVTALTREPGGGRVTGVRVRDRSGGERVLRAALVVGADGIRSAVAAQAPAPLLHQGRTSSAVLYRYLARLPSAGYEWAYGQGAAAGLIPTNGDLTCVFVSTTPARMKVLRRAGAEAAFAGLLRAVSPAIAARVDAAAATGRVHGWAGVPAFVRRSHGAGWALVGDAGYFKDPITTHGMTDAMRDAELLATAVTAALTGEAGEAEALSAYQHTRDRLSAGLLATTEAVAAYDWDDARIKVLLRRVSSAMSDELDLLQQLPLPAHAVAQSP